MSESTHTRYRNETPRRWRCFAVSRRVPSLYLYFSILVGIYANADAQTLNSVDVTQDGSQTARDSSNSRTTGSSQGAPTSIFNDSTFGAQSTTLTTAQIIAFLGEHPEVMIELKSLLADQMQLAGNDVRSDSITDEMLYAEISKNSDLRTNITAFLRGRGYFSDEILRPQGPGIVDRGVDATLPSSLLTTGLPPDIESRFTSAGALDSEARGALQTQDARGVTPLPSRLPASGSRNSAVQQQREQTVNSSTDEPKVLRSPAPYNLQSMRDLYTQIPDQSAPLKRFGSEVFADRNAAIAMRGGTGRDTPLDVPLGPDYIVGPGDTLAISLWGGVTQNITRVVDRDGRILLPEAGSVNLAGLALGRVESLIESALSKQFRGAQVTVTVSQLRSVRVYVVGDVQRPGGFDISSLATPLSALFAAGGPTAAGSLRVLRHYRGKRLIDEIDLYDFLLHGERTEGARFESGDVLLVPPAGEQVAISGAVRRPAIYELKTGESNLALVIEDAGGLTVAASLSHITIDRINPNRQRETVTLPSTDSARSNSDPVDLAMIAAFPVKDGDRIRIAPILPNSERTVYLDGHVRRPGRKPYRDGMKLSDVLQSYQDMLPEPANQAEIVRLVSPDLHAETIAFDVAEVLTGSVNIALRPLDTIRIFGRYQVDAPTVTIRGEVLRPGSFPLSNGMTAAQLVRMAGGLKRDALLDAADLTSYTVADGSKVIGTLTRVRIGAAVAGNNPAADVPLKSGDILTIHQITGWNEIGEAVVIDGQVAFPGSYGFREGERLSSVLRRAGGFRDTAYPAGAVLVRDQVRELEQKSRDELIRQIETSSAAARLSPNLGSDTGATLQLIQAQQDQALSRLRSQPPAGRMVIHISSDIATWENTPADIELRRGDVVTIPKRPGFVLVTGQVYNPTAVTFAPNKTAGWYLSHAGGSSSAANRKEIFIIRANGSVIGRNSGGWFDAVLSTKLDPGDVVVVPQKVIGGSLFWRNLLTVAQLASSIAITTAVAAL